MGSGDGWTRCSLGHTHWGRYGAAGLLISDGARVILQHRAPWTHEGGSWGIPGGARDAHESAVDAALREAHEEAGLAASDLEPLALYTVDHGGWSYTTVLARPRRALYPTAANAESVEVRWMPIDEVAALTLHGGFATAWPHVQRQPDRLRVLISTSLSEHPGVRVITAQGIPVSAVPSGFDSAGVHRMIPELRFVSDVPAAMHLAVQADRTAVLVLDNLDLARLVDGSDTGLH